MYSGPILFGLHVNFGVVYCTTFANGPRIPARNEVYVGLISTVYDEVKMFSGPVSSIGMFINTNLEGGHGMLKASGLLQLIVQYHHRRVGLPFRTGQYQD